jgi:uncharacterized membrane protein YbhN (UPF0104 family)
VRPPASGQLAAPGATPLVLTVVIMVAATIGGAAPTPGGMGVVEASMILGLTAAGVSEADATAAVFIQRLLCSASAGTTRPLG